MKILHLRFKNLNALMGEWRIDFTHSAYKTNGIFAITGPTGAGKSTILDAISLALYGATPRLGRLTQSSNDIMSRHTGDCFAELTFAVGRGQYRVFWSQRRAHGRSDGALQPAKHELSNAQSGELLATQLREVSRQIEQLSGLDFDRFTRAMLLAQGSFAAFLQASPDERAPILEQITGTKIYSDISQQVHRLLADEQEKLRNLEAKLSGISVLSQEEELRIQETLEQGLKKQQQAGEKLERARQLQNQLEQLQTLQQEQQHLTRQQRAWQQDFTNFAPKQAQLEQATKAAALESAYTALVKQRDLVTQTQAKIVENEKRKPQRQLARNKAQAQLQTARQQLTRNREQQQAAAPHLQKMRSYDHKIAEQRGQANTAKDNYRRKHTQLQDRKTELEQAQQRLQAQSDQVQQHLVQDTRLQALAWLEAHRSGVEVRVSQWQLITEQLHKAREVLQSRQKQLDHLEHVAKQLGKARNKAVTDYQAVGRERSQYQSQRDELLDGRVVAEIRREYAQLVQEKNLRQRIASLEEERQRLQAGEPCPLCGATEHPYQQHAPAVPDALDSRIDALDKQLSAIESIGLALDGLQRKVQKADERMIEADKALEKIKQEVTLATVAEQQQQTTIEQLSKQQHEVKTELWTLVSGADLDAMLRLDANANPAHWQEVLQQAHQKWQAQVHAYDAVRKTYDHSQRAVEHLVATLQELQAESEALYTVQVDAEQALQALENERRKQFGELSADEEAQRLQTAVEDAQRAVNLASEEFQQQHHAYELLRQQAEQLNNTKTQAENELNTLEETFSQALTQQGFSNEARFLTACLPNDVRQQLQQQAQQLQEEKTRLQAQYEAVENKVNHLQKTLERNELSLDEACEQVAALQQQYDAAVSQTASLKQQLSEHQRNKEHLQDQQKLRDAQKKTVEDWSILHQLIGSSDGKKYRNFAQGLTFERVIYHANQQLQKLTDRYLLLRDANAPLELNVIDNFQAGEIRSTKNLSGGESFIVSLALALGLSSMSSQRIRVDALFLDEGFGTLDEDVLDTALETLASLQHDGKLIGVISHVAALKERITTRIQVNPSGGGRSRLQGPGCQMVNNDRVATP